MKTNIHSVLIVLSLLLACNNGAEMPPGTWSLLGPELIEPRHSGRATVIQVNPYKENDVWLGTATGGVWHLADATVEPFDWKPMSEAAQSQAIGALALRGCNATRCDTVWIGTGENNVRRDTYYGSGIYRLIWNATTSKYDLAVVGDTDTFFKGGVIYKILFKGREVYAIVGLGKTSSSSGTITPSPPPPSGFGLFKSGDNGNSWQAVGTLPSPGTYPVDMEITTAGNIFVAFMGEGIYWLKESTGQLCPLHASGPGCAETATGGLPNASVTQFDFIELDVSKSNPSVLYAVYGQCSSETYLCFRNPRFFKSTNGGFNWIEKSANTAGEILETYSRYTHGLTVHPRRAETFYYAAVRGIWYSIDSGDNIQFMSVGNNYIGALTHFDLHEMNYVNSISSLMYMTTDGGVFKSQTFDRMSWTSLNDGLSTAQFYTISVNKSGERIVIGGTQDNGTVLFNGAHMWQYILSGDGGDCYIENADEMYASVQHMQPFVSYDGGTSFSSIVYGLDIGEASLVSPMFTKHPATGELYISGERLYKYSDSQWKSVSPIFDPSPTVIAPIEKKNVISAMGLSRTDRELILVGMHDGTIWKPNECGPCTLLACWKKIVQPIISGVPQPVGPVSSIEIDPRNSNVIYTTHSTFNSDGTVFKSTDRGETWARFDSDLPPAPSKIIKVDPSNSQILWLGRDDGIFYKQGDNNWLKYGLSQGIPEMPVYDIDFDGDGNAYAATHGRGIYTLANAGLWDFISWKGNIWSRLSLYGYAFKNRDCPCSLKIFKDGKINDQSTTPAIKTNSNGQLISLDDDKNWKYGIHMLNGNNEDADEVEVSCSNETVRRVLKPSSDKWFTTNSLKIVPKRISKNSSFRLHLPGADGCSINIPLFPDDSSASISQRALLGLGKVCKSYRVRKLEKSKSEEDDPDLDWIQFIGLSASVQPILECEIRPETASGLVLHLRNIGNPVKRLLTPIGVQFTTTPSGAEGGKIIITLESSVGTCMKTIRLQKGSDAKQILKSIYESVQSTLNEPGCATYENLQDFEIVQDHLGVFNFATGLTIEVLDKSVGLKISGANRN